MHCLFNDDSETHFSETHFVTEQFSPSMNASVSVTG